MKHQEHNILIKQLIEITTIEVSRPGNISQTMATCRVMVCRSSQKGGLWNYRSSSSSAIISQSHVKSRHTNATKNRHFLLPTADRNPDCKLL